MNKVFATLIAGALPVLAFAQTANISRTDMDNATGVLVSSGLQNAVGVTYFDNDAPRTFVVIKNGSGSTLTVTELTQQTSLSVDRYGSVALSNQTVTLANGETRLIGPFPSARWNTANATVGISLSTIVGVSESVVRVPK